MVAGRMSSGMASVAGLKKASMQLQAQRRGDLWLGWLTMVRPMLLHTAGQVQARRRGTHPQEHSVRKKGRAAQSTAGVGPAWPTQVQMRGRGQGLKERLSCPLEREIDREAIISSRKALLNTSKCGNKITGGRARFTVMVDLVCWGWSDQFEITMHIL